MPTGIVITVNRGKPGIFTDVDVMPYNNFKRLDEVLIVKNNEAFSVHGIRAGPNCCRIVGALVLPIDFFKPDLAIPLVIYATLFLGPPAGLLTALLLGLAQEVLSSAPAAPYCSPRSPYSSSALF